MTQGTPVEALKAIAHPLRYEIIRVLAQKERNVGEIEDVTGIGQPMLSQQLAILRKADLVTTRKVSKLVFYSLATNALNAAIQPLFDMAGQGASNTLSPTDRPARRPINRGAANFARLP